MKTEQFHIEAWPIEKLVPSPANAKEHPDDQVDALAKSIARFGWDQPIVVDADGEIIKGHGRRLAAMKLGMTVVPVLVRKDLTKMEARAARLSDNRVVSTSYDSDLLKEELKALNLDATIDIGDLGFSAKELDFLNLDLGTIDTGAFVDNVNAAVEDQKRQNDEKVEEIDKSEVSVGEALGFKKVSLTASRRIRKFIAQLEDETGEKGAFAFDAFLIKSGM